MNLDSVKTWAHDLGTWVHLKHPNELDAQATETIIKSATGLAPSEEEAAHLVQLAGNKIGGLPVKPGEIFAGAPHNSDDLIKNIGDAVKSGLNSLLLNWKDKHFPQKLDAALDKQAGVMTKLRKVVAEVDLQQTTVTNAKADLDKTIAELETQIAATPDQATKDRLGIVLNTNKQNALTLDTKLKVISGTKSEFESELTALEAKHKTDTQMATVLKSEWSMNRQLKDLPADIKTSYESMIDLGQDADRIGREITERQAQAKAALDEALKHGGPVTGA